MDIVMGKIICLMGKSSSGKDTIFKLLKEDKELNLLPVITYTTRPKRSNETDGTEYIFIDESKLKDYEKEDKIIEKREYNTINGIWYYCTIDDGQIDLSLGNYLLITTLEAYINIQSYFKSENVLPVYITVDENTRLERATARENQQQNPNFEELNRRFQADNIDFSAEKLALCNISNSYDNYDLSKCLSYIKADLMQII